MNKGSEKHREKYKKDGLIQINAWIPAEAKEKVMQICRELRQEKLQKAEDSA